MRGARVRGVGVQKPSYTAAVGAAALSMLVPGLGQLVVGAYRRGLVLLSLTVTIVLAAGAVALAHPALGLRLLVAILALDVALLGLRVFAVVDAGRAAAPIAVAALVVLTVVPHAAAGYLAVRSYTVLDRVFATEEPRDVLASSGIFLLDKPEPDAPVPVGRPLVASPQVLTAATAERPWTTILLLGTDEGPGNWGARTDTIILVAFEHGTRRAAAFGIPRNLINVRVGGGLPVFHEPINGLYSYVRAQPGPLRPRARPRRERAQASRIATARRARRLLRTREPARLRRSRRRARRRHDPREGTAARLGDAPGLGRAEAEDRRLSGPHLPLRRPGRRSRTCGRGRTRTTTRGWRASGAF